MNGGSETMKKTKIIKMVFMATFLLLWVACPQAWSGALNPPITFEKIFKTKAWCDDPRPLYKDLDWKKILPKAEVDKLLIDPEEAKKAWAELVGFRAPDVVGKIAPEIKPGKYNYKDKAQYPGLKELMIPYHYEIFKPGAPPFPGNFSQIEIIPTRQYYQSTGFSKLTMDNLGKTKQDAKGYFEWQTYNGGVPFPKPAGPHKAIQIMYNVIFAPQASDNMLVMQGSRTYTKTMKIDAESTAIGGQFKVHGRVMEPKGWYDERAKKYGEYRVRGMVGLTPRDSFGFAIANTEYLDPAKWNNNLMYIPGMRRTRKLSATDTQDVFAGSDAISDDAVGFGQKISATIYPMEYKVIAEREYLVLAHTIDREWYYSCNGMERMNTKWERRPIYVMELTELDKAYVYGKRVLYVDKENFAIHLSMNYDREGRLYRTLDNMHRFIPEAGIEIQTDTQIVINHIDPHSTLTYMYELPDPSVGREVGNIAAMSSVK